MASPGQNSDIRLLESELDSSDSGRRQAALRALVGHLRQGLVAPAPAREAVNLHYHTFFSYNVEGYSPSRIAWLARREALAVAGIVDFDVLDGLEEFLGAGRALALRTCVGIETRVFLPEYADRVLNSPGEPGICYHVGMGFTQVALGDGAAGFLAGLRATSAQRNRQVVERVNPHLAPAELDYERDVLALAPSGNATERHICLAYARRAQSVFPDEHSLTGFWSGKLETDAEALDLPDGINLQQAIRAKLMKRDGPGYVQPDTGSFPTMQEMNRFIVEAGGIPAYAWLDGMPEGERDAEKLLDTVVGLGAEALNIIPDRNYTPGKDDARLANLREIVALARLRCLPLFVGTEMNSPGQKFVDDFESPELRPLVPAFLKGAYTAYGHMLLQRAAGLGYTSAWATRRFRARDEKNEFYETVGRLGDPAGAPPLQGLDESATPETILRELSRASQRKAGT